MDTEKVATLIATDTSNCTLVLSRSRTSLLHQQQASIVFGGQLIQLRVCVCMYPTTVRNTYVYVDMSPPINRFIGHHLRHILHMIICARRFTVELTNQLVSVCLS